MTKNRGIRLMRTITVKKYRQGAGWVVASWDPKVRAWRTSHQMSYSHACQRVRDLRAKDGR